MHSRLPVVLSSMTRYIAACSECMWNDSEVHVHRGLSTRIDFWGKVVWLACRPAAVQQLMYNVLGERSAHLFFMLCNGCGRCVQRSATLAAAAHPSRYLTSSVVTSLPVLLLDSFLYCNQVGLMIALVSLSILCSWFRLSIMLRSPKTSSRLLHYKYQKAHLAKINLLDVSTLQVLRSGDFQLQHKNDYEWNPLE
jgi:hypothetical protein